MLDTGCGANPILTYSWPHITVYFGFKQNANCASEAIVPFYVYLGRSERYDCKQSSKILNAWISDSQDAHYLVGRKSMITILLSKAMFPPLSDAGEMVVRCGNREVVAINHARTRVLQSLCNGGTSRNAAKSYSEANSAKSSKAQNLRLLKISSQTNVRKSPNDGSFSSIGEILAFSSVSTPPF